MRISYLCYLNPTTCDYPLFLAQAWQRIGHKVDLIKFECDLLETRAGIWVGALAGLQSSLWNSYLRSVLLRRIQRFRPEILIIGGPLVDAGAMRLIRKYCKCRIGYILGYNHLLEGDTTECIRISDFVIAHDSYVIPLLQGERYGRKRFVFHMTCMANPYEHYPVDLSECDKQRYGNDVVFIGGVYGARVDTLLALSKNDLRIWGYVRDARLAAYFCDEPVYGLKKTKIYAASRIVLNIQDEEKQINAISNRVPEVLACGGFVITDRRADLMLSGLKDEESIVCYDSVSDLRDRVAYYLEHDADRVAIGSRGREIVLKNMTYDVVGGRLIKQIEAAICA